MDHGQLSKWRTTGPKSRRWLEGGHGPWPDVGPWTDIDPWPDVGPWAVVKVEDRWAPIPTMA